MKLRCRPDQDLTLDHFVLRNPIKSMGRLYMYLCEWLMFPVNASKYNSPMDPSWVMLKITKCLDPDYRIPCAVFQFGAPVVIARAITYVGLTACSIYSMCEISTYIYRKFMVNVGKYHKKNTTSHVYSL